MATACRNPQTKAAGPHIRARARARVFHRRRFPNRLLGGRSPGTGTFNDRPGQIRSLIGGKKKTEKGACSTERKIDRLCSMANRVR